MKVTAKDIAKSLSISTSAVSLALNGRPGVSVATREKVLAEAIRMGYNGKKNELPSAGKNIRYVIFLDSGTVVKETSFYSILLQGIEVEAKRFGYNVLVSYFYTDQNWAEQIEVIAKDVSGLIVLATEATAEHISKAVENGLGRLHMPLILIDNAFDIAAVDSVIADNFMGACHAVDYLFELGHEDVGYLRSASRIESFDERQRGYLKARHNHLLTGQNKPMIVDVGISSEDAYYDMCRWLEGGHKPCSAFFAENDIIAASCIRALKAHHYRVPEDVSVIGFDDMPLCTMVDPPLTTVRVMKEQMGMTAMNILNQRIQQGTYTLDTERVGLCKVAISTSLTVRNSTCQIKS